MARRRFFVGPVQDGRAELAGDEAHHLARVLRAEPGRRYEISDNTAAYLAEVVEVTPRRVVFQAVEPLPPRTPAFEATLYAGLFKFDRFEWMVEKATELGVSAIVPFDAERSEKGLEEAARKRVERWRRIARESSEQARRDRLPRISGPVPFRECLADASPVRLFLDEEAGGAPLAGAISGERCIALLAGPEGGWTPRERAEALAAGWLRASLGPLVLRAETAVLAALAVLAGTLSQAAEPIE